MMKNGIVLENTCKEVFEVEYSDYMDALISIGLATKVTGSCEVKLPPDTPRADAIYYVPQMRKESSPSSEVNPAAHYKC